MAKIVKVARVINKGDHAVAYVLLEHGDEEYQIFIGGDVETFHHKGANKAFVKRAQSRKNTIDKDLS